jgi:hypothetical protein
LYTITYPTDPSTPQPDYTATETTTTVHGADQEPFTLETFSSIAVHAALSNKDAVYAVLRTHETDAQGVENKYISVYSAHQINRMMFRYRRTGFDSGMLIRIRVRNPMNNLSIDGKPEYYVVPGKMLRMQLGRLENVQEMAHVEHFEQVPLQAPGGPTVSVTIEEKTAVAGVTAYAYYLGDVKDFHHNPTYRRYFADQVTDLDEQMFFTMPDGTMVGQTQVTVPPDLFNVAAGLEEGHADHVHIGETNPFTRTFGTLIYANARERFKAWWIVLTYLMGVIALVIMIMSAYWPWAIVVGCSLAALFILSLLTFSYYFRNDDIVSGNRV